ncbi:hypothetical protein PCANC_11606 [Puccinia coronata f. sp. avenae]|uniref:Uncharacterized protein n=1 Tax=Puccinia coronata f. sp. avenae TaxID=200324 RepID=A0A2N5SVI5_9BASI|nr:hypothetical protein PCANC_11606 [Puccinia coronata f. sp. avenae]
MKVDGIAILTVLVSTLLSFVVPGIFFMPEDWKVIEEGGPAPPLLKDGWSPGESFKVDPQDYCHTFTMNDEALPLEITINKRIREIEVHNDGQIALTYHVRDSSESKMKLLEKTIKPGAHHFFWADEPTFWVKR